MNTSTASATAQYGGPFYFRSIELKDMVCRSEYVMDRENSESHNDTHAAAADAEAQSAEVSSLDSCYNNRFLFVGLHLAREQHCDIRH